MIFKLGSINVEADGNKKFELKEIELELGVNEVLAYYAAAPQMIQGVLEVLKTSRAPSNVTTQETTE